MEGKYNFYYRRLKKFVEVTAEQLDNVCKELNEKLYDNDVTEEDLLLALEHQACPMFDDPRVTPQFLRIARCYTIAVRDDDFPQIIKPRYDTLFDKRKLARLVVTDI